jgi:glycosyltransferase involved in cell wall biosynthesis
MVILPWWMWGWAIPFWVVGKVASSKNNTKILFICHNVIEHETAFWKGILSKFVLSIGDAFIVHSRGDYENLKGIFNQARVELRCHPSYEVFRQASISKQQARVRLNINSKYRNIILYFGITRPYKGLSYLLQAMPNIIAQIPDVFLIIAGEFWDREDKYLRQVKKLHIEDAVRIINDYIPNEEVGFYFSAVDVVVLPYVSGTGSGIVQMAFGFDKPVIATRVGCLPEVVNDGETGYLVEPKDSKAIANAVVSFYKERKESGFVANIVRGKEKFSWARMVQAIENLQ